MLLDALQVYTPRYREPSHNIRNEKAQEHIAGGSEVNTPTQVPSIWPISL